MVLQDYDTLSAMGYQKTIHFERRQVQRGIRDQAVILALKFGRRFYEKGATASSS